MSRWQIIRTKEKVAKRQFPSPTGLVYHPDYLKHDPGEDHPESSKRLSSLMSYLEKKPFWTKLKSIIPYPATVEWLETVHNPEYIKLVEKMCKNGGGMLDPDTRVGKDTFQIALLAAGGIMAAVDAVMNKKVHNAFCAVRPPGHHAEKGKGMGFCVFNNVAVGTKICAEKIRFEENSDRRLGRTPRQRNPKYLSGRPFGILLQHSSVSSLPGHRQRVRGGRG